MEEFGPKELLNCKNDQETVLSKQNAISAYKREH
jgi:hypothetical protein